MSPNRGKGGAPEPAAPAPETATLPVHQGGILPRGRIPTVGVREIVAAIHRRRDGRRKSAAELSLAIGHLGSAVERHLARIAELRQVVEKQGGDLSQLQFYDDVMARLRAELRTAERSLAEAFSVAARS